MQPAPDQSPDQCTLSTSDCCRDPARKTATHSITCPSLHIPGEQCNKHTGAPDRTKLHCHTGDSAADTLNYTQTQQSKFQLHRHPLPQCPHHEQCSQHDEIQAPSSLHACRYGVVSVIQVKPTQRWMDVAAACKHMLGEAGWQAGERASIW
jgi:hypothetical protein